MDPARSDEGWTIVLFGKTGNGKSSVGNIILSTLETREFFPVASGLTSATKTIATISAKNINVIDIPDFTNLESSGDHIRNEIRFLSNRLTNTRYAVLVAVRCDVRYTNEEYDIYKQFKALWGESICSHLIVAFTFGDRQDRDLDQQLKDVNPELKSLLSDAGKQYVLFNDMKNADDKKFQIKKMWEEIKYLPRQRQVRVIQAQPTRDMKNTTPNRDSHNTEKPWWCC